MAQADRSVSVVLKADINDYVTKMGVASKATKDFATQTGRTAGAAATSTKQLGTSAAQASGDLDKASKSTKGFGDTAGKASADVEKVSKSTKSTSDSARSLGIGMAAAGVAVAAGVGLAVKAFADFDKEMSNVRAVSGATAGEMNQLTDAALDAGAATKFSASEAATAEAELAKAGISTADILGGGLTGALSLAAAGNIDLAQAAEVSANAMNIFQLKGKDVGHIADVLAAGASKSATDVAGLGQALAQSGLVAAQMGLSLEETTGVLAVFAQNGLKGSDAGTSLKTMLQRLVPTSVEAASAMKDIGFSAYDAQGNLKSIDVVAGDLQKGLAGLTQQQKDSTLATIFGSDAVRAANVLYKIGTKGVNEWTKGVTDNGAAARIAAIQMDNLAGDLENLRGSFETALIKGGAQSNGVLRDMAYVATQAVNAFGDLPGPVQQAGIGLGAAASSVLLLGGGLVTVIPKIAQTKEALTALGLSVKSIGTFAGPLGIALGAAALATGLFVNSQLEAKQRADELRGSLDQQTGSITDNTKAIVAARLQVDQFTDASGNLTSVLDAARGAGIQLSKVTDAALGDPAAIKSINTAYETLTRQLKTLQDQAAAGGDVDFAKLQTLTDQAAAYRVVRDAIGETSDVLAPQIDQQKQLAEAIGKVGGASSTTAGSGKLLADEIKEQKAAAEDAKKAYDDLTDAVKNYGDQVAAALSATSGYEAAIDKAAEVAQKRKEIQDQINALQAGGTTSDPKAAEAAKKVAAEVEAANKKADLADATTRRNADAAAAAAKTQAERDRIRANETATLEKSQIDRQQRAAKLADAQGKSAGAAKDNSAEIARLKEQLQQYTATLDLSTEAGRANTAMLLDIATNAKNSAVENFKNGVSVEDVQKKMDGARGAFIQQAQDFGASRVEAEKLADQLGLTKENVDQLAQAKATVTVAADTAQANVDINFTKSLLNSTNGTQATATVNAATGEADGHILQTDGLLDAIDGRIVTPIINLDMSRVGPSLEGLQAMVDGTMGPRGFATGGYTGDGGKYEPKGVVHGGEFVFTKEETARAGVFNLASYAKSLRGYAGGGPVFADRAMASSAISNTYGGNVTNDRRMYIDKVIGPDLATARREQDRLDRLHALGRRGSK